MSGGRRNQEISNTFRITAKLVWKSYRQRKANLPLPYLADLDVSDRHNEVQDIGGRQAVARELIPAHSNFEQGPRTGPVAYSSTFAISPT